MRATDLAARLGGDEFAGLLAGGDIDVALRVAALEPSMASAKAWAQVADAACYAAKGEGRNAVRGGRAPALRVVGGAG